MPNLVFEVVPQLNTLVSCQNRGSPSDSEWDAWLALAKETMRTTPKPHRALVMTEGGHPSRTQQGRLAAAMGGGRALTAVVSSAPTLRFVVSALTFTNRDIKCFAPSQMDAALCHLGLATADVPVVEAVTERLRKQLTQAAGSVTSTAGSQRDSLRREEPRSLRNR